MHLFKVEAQDFGGSWFAQETIKVKISSWGLETQIEAAFQICFGDDNSFSVTLEDDNQLKQYGFNYYKEKNGLDFDRYEVIEKIDNTYHLLLSDSQEEREWNQKMKINGDALEFLITLENGNEKVINLIRSR